MDDNIAKYMVPLDELDLKLLSINDSIGKETEYSRHRSNNHFKNKMDYDSDVSSDESYSSDTNDTDSTCTDVNTKMCHICNVEVPEVYMKRHVESDKHEMHLTIANAAIERAKKQIEQNDFEKIYKCNSDKYFCDTCVLVLDIKSKSEHINSEFHITAVRKERILKDLINVYMFNEDVIEYKYNDINDDNTDDIQTNFKAKYKKTKSDRNTDKLKLPEDNEISEVIHNVKSIDNDNLIIEIYNNFLKIKMEAYHGLILLTKHRYKCLLCSDTFKKKSKHISSTKHTDKVSLPIKDRNCIRKLNTYKFHCILCNEIINNDAEHITGDEHKDRLHSAVVIDEGTTKTEANNDLARKVKRKKHSSDKIVVKLKSCICHICNTRVPECFLREHVNSSKHKMYLKIATVALERVNRNMNQNISSSSPIHSVHFCEVCVSGFSDKQCHIQSNSHRVAVKKDKMFKSLLQLYVDDDIDSVHCEKIPESLKEISTDNKKHERNNLLNDRYMNCMTESNESVTRDNEISFTIEDKDISEDHIAVLNTGTVNSHVLKTMDEKYYIIQTKECCQKVERNNYHSFKKIGKRRYECQLCGSACQRKGIHILSERHLNNISKPIKDQHCIREVDSIKSHCILCNELIESYLLHTLCNERHEELLKNSILNDDETKVREVEIANNASVKYQAEESAKVYSDNKVETNIDLDLSNVFDNAASEINLESQTSRNITCELNKKNIHPYSFLIETTDKGNMCTVCEVIVPDTTQNITEHLDGKRHKDVVTKLLERNDVRIINDKFYCGFCDTNIVGRHLDHIKVNIHKQNVQKRVTSTSELDDVDMAIASPPITLRNGALAPLPTTSGNTGVRYNEIVKGGVTSNEIKPLLNATVTSKENEIVIENNELDITSISEVVPINRYIMNRVDNLKEILCNVCDTIVPLRINNIEEHLNGKKHKNNEQEMFEKNRLKTIESGFHCEVCCIDLIDGTHYPHIQTFIHKAKTIIFDNGNIKNNDPSVIKMRILIAYVLEITPKGNEVLCKICQVKMSNNLLTINGHLDGKQHTNKEKEFFENNNLKMSNSQFHCDLCNVSIIEGEQYSHIESASHKMNRENAKTKLNAIGNVTTEKDVPNGTDGDKYFGIVSSKPHVMRCTICSVDVPDSAHTVKMHIQGTKHLAKLKQIFPGLN